jgi:hypothetical protein
VGIKQGKINEMLQLVEIKWLPNIEVITIKGWSQ